MAEIETTPMPQKTKELSQDELAWKEILKILLDGVMFHILCFEHFTMHNMCGFAALHKYHAQEEFKNYTCACYHYTKHYKSIPELSHIKPTSVTITGTYENALEVYENWEKKVLEKLQHYCEHIKDGKDDIEDLICDVKKELYCIRRMWDDIYNSKGKELDEWLYKKYGEC